jgi:DNA-binding IclR family transcriptional regulator
MNMPCTSGGQAILTQGPKNLTSVVKVHRLQCKIKNTVTNREDLEDKLDEIRDRRSR